MAEGERRRLIQQVARETAREVGRNAGRAGARETLVDVGIDAENPIEAQKTMAALREIAALAPDLAVIAKHYRDKENLEAVHFAKRAHRLYKSTLARTLTGAGALVYAWLAGVFDSALRKMGLG